MKRTAFDERRDQRVADDAMAGYMPCNVCRTQTPQADLSDYGGRCNDCYGRYLAESNPAWWPNRPLTPSERQSVIAKATKGLRRFGQAKADPRAWAHALKARELGGERLTEAQRAAWRQALKAPQHEESEA